jgi:hypothetical protein
MRVTAPNLLAAMALIALADVALPAPRHVESVRVTGPTLVAFFPYEFKDSNDEGAIEGAAHLGFAIEDTIKCLQPKKVKVYFLYADVVVLTGTHVQERFAVHRLGQGVGAVLVEPSQKGKVVFSVEGPSTLQFLLPQAAAQYWNAAACRE